MSIPRPVRPSGSWRPSRKPLSSILDRGNARLLSAVAVLALVTLPACENGTGVLPTGITQGPVSSTIPTTNTSTLEVRIANPSDGDAVSGTVSIEVRTKEKKEERARTDLFIGEELVTSSTAERFTYSWSTGGHSGAREITAVGWDVEGRRVRGWGGPMGTAAPGGLRGWFRVATGVEVVRDTVYVADFYNRRIQLFTGKRRYLGQVPDSLQLPTSAVPGDRGELYVADFGNGRIARFRRDP